MCGTRSKLPEVQTIDIDQDSESGTNIAEINFDLRSKSETKVMDAFIQIHEGTMIGMTVGIVVTITISLLLYGFGRCWCAKIHRLCGEARNYNSNNIEMDDDINTESEANKTNEMDRAKQGRRNSKIIMIK